MHVITGATGRVGQAAVRHLLDMEQPVRAVVRDRAQSLPLTVKGVNVAIADLQTGTGLRPAMVGASTAFLITPHDPQQLVANRQVWQNYRNAMVEAGIQKIVGLSCIDARQVDGVVNGSSVYPMENAFTDVPGTKIFLRPAYYFSNWDPAWETAKSSGVMPTFFPPDLPLPMIAPQDVGKVAAQLLASPEDVSYTYELHGPMPYSSRQVADVMGYLLGKQIEVRQMPWQDWEALYSPPGLRHEDMQCLSEMALTRNEKKADMANPGNQRIIAGTTLLDYFRGLYSGR